MELVLYVVLLMIGVTGAQNCGTDDLINNLGSSGGNLVALSLSSNGRGDVPTVTILDQNIVCLVTDTVRGQYTGASVVVSYNCDGSACPMMSEL